MFRLQGPFPLLKTTVLLPSFLEGNNRALTSSVQPVRAMDGTLYTYIKTKRGRRVHNWDFRTTKSKADEIKSFVDLYSGQLVRAYDHLGGAYLGYLTMNPIELMGEGRAGGWPSGEVYRFSLQLEEKV